MPTIISLDNDLIDTSALPVAPNVQKVTWKPPPHAYFGKRMEDGSMETEPVYTHKEFPKMMYHLVLGRARAVLVNSIDEMNKLNLDVYKDSPEAFGIVTAPSFDQVSEAIVAREKDKKRYKGEAVFEGAVERKAK